jgi:hypothetical protein
LIKRKIGAVLSLMCIEDIEHAGDDHEGVTEDHDEELPSRAALLRFNAAAAATAELADGEGPEASDTSVAALLNLFSHGGHGYSQTINAGPHKIVYHHINLPDLADPSMLAENGVEHVLEESTLFLDLALRVTNVLVHCQFGQRRSPSVLISWMMTKGFTLKQCLRAINSEYRACTNWAEGYCRRRRLWLTKLVNWRKNYREFQRAWFEANRATVKTWVHALKNVGEAQLAPDTDANTAVNKRHRTQ